MTRTTTPSRMQYGSWELRRPGRGQWQPQFRQRSTQFLPVPLCITSLTSRCTAPRRMSFTWATLPGITARWCLLPHLRLCTARVGTIRPMSAVTGMEHPTLTESAWRPRGVRERVGASRSVSDTPMVILTTIRGGDHGATTELAAGGRPGGTATAAMPAQTSTGAGGIPRTPVPGLLGRIPIRGTMVGQAEPLSKTRNAVPLVLRAVAPIPTSIPATPSRGVGPPAITRRPALWLAAAPDTRAICTVAKGRLAAAALPTTQTLAPESPRALTTFTLEKTATCTAMTVRLGIGLKTAATDGSPRPNPRPICNSNGRPVP